MAIPTDLVKARMQNTTITSETRAPATPPARKPSHGSPVPRVTTKATNAPVIMKPSRPTLRVPDCSAIVSPRLA